MAIWTLDVENVVLMQKWSIWTQESSISAFFVRSALFDSRFKAIQSSDGSRDLWWFRCNRSPLYIIWRLTRLNTRYYCSRAHSVVNSAALAFLFFFFFFFSYFCAPFLYSSQTTARCENLKWNVFNCAKTALNCAKSFTCAYVIRYERTAFRYLFIFNSKTFFCEFSLLRFLKRFQINHER